MIHFDFDWSDTVSLITLAAAIVLLPAILWLLASRNGGHVGRKIGVKILLNVILWLSVVAFVLQPQFTFKTSLTTGIVAGDEVPAAFVRHLQDSLQKSGVISVKEVQHANVDTLVLVGNGFPQGLYSGLKLSARQPVVRWLPYFAPDEFMHLKWKGILRKGEMQEVSGRIRSSEKQVLKVAFGGNTLDSTILIKGENGFKLRFPAFAEGRTSVTLSLGAQVPDTLRFFAQAASPLTVRFILESPDFESRNLAAWLGKGGHAVIYDVAIAKDLRSSIKINAASAPDLIVTNAANANAAAVKKALASGASVLFIGLTDPEAEIRRMNEAAGTRFQLRKISNEPAVKVLPGLEALPYQFVSAGNQINVPGMPVVIEKRGGKVGVSLLNETFPMQLAGDTLTFRKVWGTILAHLQPAGLRNLEVDAPILEGVKTCLGLNNFPALPRLITFGKDSLFPLQSPFNANAGAAEFMPAQPGWVALQDSIPAEVFIQKDAHGAQLQRLSDFVSAYENQLINSRGTKLTSQAATDALPEWAWYLWLVICFAALWIEDKFS
ncbi:hypothetical protein [Dyadobacter crusticola]|uniref:hypothetical protein n=1 Tax=Dyadobacter crusticola TaxID=292407 RepID=UPI0004E21185|nr:hypothetical protein [Dyadobacter crusticola]